MTEPRLTSAEMANLWNVYVNNTMSECILKYISNQAEDREVLSIVEYALQAARNNLRESAILLKKEGMPIPRGFTDEDVNIHADRLFTDHFFLAYLQQMCKAGFIAYGLSLSMSARADIRAYFLECLRLNTELFQKVSDVLLQKGLFSHAPFIPTPHHIDFVQDQGFLTGWFGKRKPLLAVEIAYLHHNIMTNAVGKALITGFAQVCANPDIRAFFLRGKRLANKQMEVFSSYLKEEDLPAPKSLDSDVLASTESPFSDRLMLFHALLITASGMGNYGQFMSFSTRRDLFAQASRLFVEIAQYAEDGMNLQIKHGWLEQPPQSVDRDELIRR